MKSLQRILPLILCLSLLLSLCACGGNGKDSTEASPAADSTDETPTETEEETLPAELPFAPETTGIYLTRDGSIQSAEVTSFDNSDFDEPRYDLKTLLEFVGEVVDEYNEAKGKTAVKIEDVSEADKKATLILSYDSINSFLDFQGTDFGVTAVEVTNTEYAARNFDLNGLNNAAGGMATPLEALEDETLTVVAVSGSTVVYCSGEVKFLSAAMTLTGPNSVRVNSEETCYIFFK